MSQGGDGHFTGAPKSFLKAAIHVGVPIVAAVIVARLVGDAIVDSLGRWPSIGIGTLAALIVGMMGSIVLERILYRA